MLGRLLKEGKVRKSKEVSAREGKVNVNASYVWSIVPDVDFEKQGYNKDKRIPIDPDNKDHELDCADFLVSLAGAIHPDMERLTHWDYAWTKEERKAFSIDAVNDAQGYGVNYDRHLIFDNREYFLEVDRGSKNPGYVFEQFKRYKAFFDGVGKNDARLLITAQKYRFTTDQARASMLWNMVNRLGFGRRALVTVHSHALEYPLGAVWKPAGEPNVQMPFFAP